MKKVMAVAMVTALALGSAWASAVYAADKAPKTEQPVTMDQLPAPVKAALEKEAKGGTIGEVTQENEKGKMLYEARISKDGKDRYVYVAPDGKIVKRESAKKEAKEEAKPNR